MHNVTMGGPLLYALWAFAYLSVAGGLFVGIDSLRRSARRLGAPAWRWFWFLPQAVFVALFGANYLPMVAGRLDGAVVALLVPAVVLQVAYLLRVVWPSPKRLERLGEKPAVADEAPPADDESDEGPEA